MGACRYFRHRHKTYNFPFFTNFANFNKFTIMFALQPQLSTGSNGLRTADHDNSRHYQSLLDITIRQEDGDTFNQDLIDFDHFKIEEPTLSNISSTSNSSAVPFQIKAQYQINTSICKSPPSNFTSQVPAQESANKVPSTFCNEFAKTADRSADESVSPFSPSPLELLSFGLNQDNTNSFPASPVQSQDQSSTCRAPTCDQDRWTSSVDHLNCPPSNLSDMLLGESGVGSPVNCSERKIINPAYPVHDADVAKKNSVHCDEDLFTGIDTKEYEGSDTNDVSKLALEFGNHQVPSQEIRPNCQQFAKSNCKAAKNPTKHCEVQHVRENVEVQHISDFRKFYFYPLVIPSGRLYKDELIDVQRCVYSFKENNKTKYRCKHHKCTSDHTFTNKEKCLQHIQQEHFGWEYRCPHPGCTVQVTKYHNMIEKHSQTTHDRLMHLSSAKTVKGEWHDHYGPPVEVTMGESNPLKKRKSNEQAMPVAGKRMCQQRTM